MRLLADKNEALHRINFELKELSLVGACRWQALLFGKRTVGLCQFSV